MNFKFLKKIKNKIYNQQQIYLVLFSIATQINTSTFPKSGSKCLRPRLGLVSETLAATAVV